MTTTAISLRLGKSRAFAVKDLRQDFEPVGNSQHAVAKERTLPRRGMAGIDPVWRITCRPCEEI